MQTVAMALDETRPLLDGLRRGDDDAFAALVRQQAGRMLATARRLLRSRSVRKIWRLSLPGGRGRCAVTRKACSRPSGQNWPATT